jgi:hypothetical protein
VEKTSAGDSVRDASPATRCSTQGGSTAAGDLAASARLYTLGQSVYCGANAASSSITRTRGPWSSLPGPIRDRVLSRKGPDTGVGG